MRRSRSQKLISGAVAAFAVGSFVIGGAPAASAAGDKSPELCKAVRALNANFSSIDGASNGRQDGWVTRDDINVFRSRVPTQLSIMLQPLTVEANFHHLEVAMANHTDGIVGMNDLRAFLGSGCG